MIINEKYLMDIDDEDEDDVITSSNSNEFSNKKHLDYDFTVKTFNDRML